MTAEEQSYESKCQQEKHCHSPILSYHAHSPLTSYERIKYWRITPPSCGIATIFPHFNASRGNGHCLARLRWVLDCSDREAGARLHRVRLPDHERKLEPGAANRIQVRTDRGERKPALCGHRSQPRALARTAVVRGVVLSTRRHGEPHQRIVLLVCRAGERRDDLRQSATPLFLRYGLCVARRSAPPRAKRHRDGARTSGDDSPTTAQDRRADPHHGAQDLGGNGLQLSLPASVPARLSTTARLNLPGSSDL